MKSLVRGRLAYIFLLRVGVFSSPGFPWRKSFHLEHQFLLKAKEKHLSSPQESREDSVVSFAIYHGYFRIKLIRIEKKKIVKRKYMFIFFGATKGLL